MEHCVFETWGNWHFVSLVHWIVYLGFWILVNLVVSLEFGILVEEWSHCLFFLFPPPSLTPLNPTGLGLLSFSCITSHKSFYPVILECFFFSIFINEKKNNFVPIRCFINFTVQGLLNFPQARFLLLLLYIPNNCWTRRLYSRG